MLRLDRRAVLGAALLAIATGTAAAQEIRPREGVFIARDFRFHSGETMPELRLGYTTLGDPSGEPVLVLHGTAGTGAGMLAANFGGHLFGPGQPLDARRHFIILPDAIGTGRSSKPSDGLRARFPRYNYTDMVTAQHRLVTEGLGVRHLRLVIGNSMGGMHAWLWAATYPELMDAAVPMASQPTPMSGRNWMMRRLLVESVRGDPDYAEGNYTTQPRSARFANVFYGVATNGGTLRYQTTAPSRDAADRQIDERLAAAFPMDANDFVFQWDSSRDYDASQRLEAIRASVLVINSADDERNPPETGLLERALARVQGARLFVIPASNDTFGHGTTGNARFWANELRTFLEGVPRRTM